HAGASRLAAVALAIALLCAAGQPGQALAGPVGGQVVGGSASISSGASLTTINQLSNRAIINWQGFGVDKGQTVQFIQPGASAAILNRVTGGLPSHIDGSLLANGRVFLVNPNGIVVGANGLVNVNGGFVASTQNVGNDAFMAGGALNFSGAQDGSIQVLGQIDSAGGPITLIAPKTSIAAGASLKAGEAIQLIAASQVSLSNGQFTVTPKTGDLAEAGQLSSAGALQAAQVQLAAVNNNLGALAINTSGTIRATGVQAHPDGSVSIVATGQGRNEVKGATISAVNADGSGGRIDVTGQHTGVLGAAVLDASAAQGAGGSVRVGGGWQGKEADLANAQVSFVGEGAQLKADAAGQGDGGRVVVWADDTTRYNGNLSAQGAGTGQGGNAEVSGKITLAFNGTADLQSGDKQSAGTLLLDPSNITISTGADTNFSTAAVPWTSSGGGDSILNTTTLQSALNGGANITVQTDGTQIGTVPLGPVGQKDAVNGDIWVKNPITWTTARTLTLNAHDDVFIDASIIANAGGLNVNSVVPTGATTNRNVYVNAPVTTNSTLILGPNGLLVGANVTGSTTLSLNGGGSSLGAPVTANGFQGASTLGEMTFANNPVLTGNTLYMFSGQPAATGGSDITPTNVTLRPTAASNVFANLQVMGFKNITPTIQNADGTPSTSVKSGSHLALWARQALDLSAYTQLETGAAGSLYLTGGNSILATVAQNDVNGKLTFAPNTALSAGTGNVYIGSGYAGGTRSDFTTATLKYADPSNTFGQLNIAGFSNIDLNLLNNDGTPSNLLESSNTIYLSADDRLKLQENVRTGVAGTLDLRGGANAGTLGGALSGNWSTGTGRIEFGASPQTFTVGTGAVSMQSGTTTANSSAGRSDMTNVTLQYRDGTSATTSFSTLYIGGFNNTALKLLDNTGALDQTVYTNSTSIYGTGLITAPQNFQSNGGVTINNVNAAAGWPASTTNGQLVLRDPADPNYTGVQSFDASAVSLVSGNQLVARTDLTNVVFGPASGGDVTMSNIFASGFDDVRLRLADPAALLTLTNTNASALFIGATTGDVTIENNINFSGTNNNVQIFGKSINTGANVLDNPASGLTLAFTGTSTQPSTVNMDAQTLAIGGTLNGSNT
ncbi:MAG: putative bpaA, partial [Polaromonas sp.]|nr:putative bpaA [Polaromonas sp.]